MFYDLFKPLRSGILIHRFNNAVALDTIILHKLPSRFIWRMFSIFSVYFSVLVKILLHFKCVTKAFFFFFCCKVIYSNKRRIDKSNKWPKCKFIVWYLSFWACFHQERNSPNSAASEWLQSKQLTAANGIFAQHVRLCASSSESRTPIHTCGDYDERIEQTKERRLLHFKPH